MANNLSTLNFSLGSSLEQMKKQIEINHSNNQKNKGKKRKKRVKREIQIKDEEKKYE